MGNYDGLTVVDLKSLLYKFISDVGNVRITSILLTLSLLNL